MKEDSLPKSNSSSREHPSFSERSLAPVVTGLGRSVNDPSSFMLLERGCSSRANDSSSKPNTIPEKQVSAARLADFYGRDYVVTSEVLIPRPETEMMVDAVLNLVGKAYLPGVKPGKAKLSQDCRILDVGTGSGCIAVTLALELPEAEVVACDISEAALTVARENAERLGADVEFAASDLMSSVKDSPDVLVANLPYVDKNWDWIDKEALSAEPALALYAEDGGLALIKKLIQQASKRNIPYLVLEADPCQHERIIDFALGYNYSILETRGFCLVFSRGSRRG